MSGLWLAGSVKPNAFAPRKTAESAAAAASRLGQDETQKLKNMDEPGVEPGTFSILERPRDQC